MKKGKIKNFIKGHKEEIIIGISYGIAMTVACALAYNSGISEGIKKGFNGLGCCLKADHGKTMDMIDSMIKPDELDNIIETGNRILKNV